MNDAMQTGLRHRLRRALRRVEAQHQHLRPLLAEAEEASRVGADGPLRERLTRFCDALRAHFELEDQVIFPALHGLSPASQARLETLSDEHGVFLSELLSLQGAAAGSAAEALPRLRAALGEHERREEQLLESIVGSDALRGP